MITGRDEEMLGSAQREIAGAVIAVAGDVSDPAHRVELAKEVAKIGELEVVVNNASILGPSPMPALLDYPIEQLENVYRVNAVAPLALLQVLWPLLKPEGRILNIASDAGLEAYEEWGGYGSSKAALEQISAILAAENPSRKVYWVDPGDMRTDMHQAAFPNEDISDRALPEESVPGLLRLIEADLPSGRYRTADLLQAIS